MIRRARRTPSSASPARGGLFALAALALSMAPVVAVSTPSDAAPTVTRTAAAQPASPWTAVAARPSDTRGDRALHPTAYRAYHLDAAAMTAALGKAHGEGRRAVPAQVTLPDPQGNLITFTVTESSLYQPGLAAEYPDFKQYVGTSADGKSSLAIDDSPYGLHASVRGDGTSFLVDPATIGSKTYLSYRASDLPEPEQKLVEPELDAGTVAHIKKQGQRFGEPPNGQVSLRTYRLAFLTDPTYAEYVAPGSNSGAISDTESNRQVLAAKTVLMDRVNQIYGSDLAVKLILVDGTDKMNFNTNAETYNANGPCGSAACFTTAQISGGCASALLTRNRLVVGQLIGASNFDIGHIGLGINGGGIASLGVVGGNNKAQGCTGLPQPVGDFYAIDYVAHEMGHQFSGNHTFNGTQVNCSTSNRNGLTGVEPGSGSSVMAYAGICVSDDLQPHTDPYFSQRSQTEISSYLGSALANVNELQEFGLTNFATNGNSFTLTYPSFTNALGATVAGGTTAAIVRGTNYTAAGMKTAIEAVTGATVTVTGMFNTGAPGDTGFSITYTGNLAGVDVPTPTLTPVSQTSGLPISVIANDIAKGGAPTNNGVLSTFGNHAPDVTVPATKYIPTRTPFTLTGSATDVDGDNLLYLWEQNDNGPSATNAGTGLITQPKVNGPLFRVFSHYATVTSTGTLQSPSPGENLATSDSSRTFPDMDQILSGATNQLTGSCPTPVATDFINDTPTRDLTAAGFGIVPNTLKNGPELECFSEFLPTSAYLGTPAAGNAEPSLNFRLTARDQDVFSGGYQYGDVKLRLDRTAGPLYVTGFNTPGTTYAGGATLPLTWDVNGTDKPNLAPNVKISLSTDGGHTFPTVLVASTPNDGSQDITLPVVAASSARLKVEAVGNYFFDVNHADFAIAPQFTLAGSIDDQTVQYSDAPVGAFTVTSATGDSSTITAAATGLPAGLSLAQTQASAPGVIPGTATYAIVGSLGVAAGSYAVDLLLGDGQSSQSVTVNLTAAPEDASVVYTGPTALEVPAGTTATVLDLSADVTEDDDASPGDLTTASATFTDTTTGATLCSAPVLADGTVSCDAGVDLPMGSDRDLTVAVSLSGNYAGSTAGDTTVHLTVDQGIALVGPEVTTVTATYSDALDTPVQVTAMSDFASADFISVSTEGLPAGLSVVVFDRTADGVTPGVVTYAVVGTATDAVGTYPVTLTFQDSRNQPATTQFTVVVTPESASATYTGPSAVEAATGGTGAESIPLTAVVAQQADGTPGDLTTATASFVDATTGDVLCTDSSVGADGAASCTMSADLPSGGAGRTYAVRVTVGGNFAGTSAGTSPLMVTVDGAAPETAITSGPADNSVVLSNVVALAFTSSDPDADFLCTLDGAPKACAGGELVLGPLGQGTHTVQVASVDAAGNLDATPESRTFTVPVNDRRLKVVKHTGGWNRTGGHGAYLGTLSAAKAKGSTLSYDVVDTTALKLVAQTKPGYGRVKVLLDGVVLRTVSLDRPELGNKVIPVGSFATPRSGTVTLVAANGKPVKITGLAVVG